MILAIESSCDESAIAVFDPKTGLVEEVIHTQIELHSEYGGVVPDLASREHLVNFPALLKSIQLNNYKENISSIAVTRGPGLAGCLAMGGALAKSLSLAFNKPLYGVNHLRGHAWSPFINMHRQDPEAFGKNLATQLPHLGLIVSGGNTLLFEINQKKEIIILAQTVDDAAGEALDKGGKLLGLCYPAGPKIESLAKEGDEKGVEFPRAVSAKNDRRFSFSGLKTSLRYKLEKLSDQAQKDQLKTLCASYQAAVFHQLINKTEKLIADNHYKSLGLSGGVANNQILSGKMASLAQKHKLSFYYPDAKHNGDNAGMIAFAAYVDSKNTMKDSVELPLKIEPSISLSD